MFVGGAFERPAGGATIDVRDKASGEIFATAGLATEADVDRAIAAAKAAQPGWAERTYAERGQLMRDVVAVLADRAKPMRKLIMRETGCIGGKADYEIGAAISELTEAAGLASRATGEVCCRPGTRAGSRCPSGCRSGWSARSRRGTSRWCWATCGCNVPQCRAAAWLARGE
jgi:benzaldehyde dehydrogenase (NAD)